MYKEMSFFVVGLVFILGSFGVAEVNASKVPGEKVEKADDSQQAENVIYMIPDGFSAAYATNYRLFKGEEAVWDEHLRGMYTTNSADSSITDSAAAGTAMATGEKTNNGMLGIDPEGNELTTILEVLQEEGKSSGLIATSTITHATPAAFASHVEDRSNESDIAKDLLNTEVDILLGGGKNNFLPESKGGNQEGEENLIAQAKEQHYDVVETRDQLLEVDLNVEEGEKLLGLFADEALPPEVHRNKEEDPSLAEMTEAALNILQDDEDGFFLMVEGSQIDWAGHDNDAGWAMTDVEAFEKAVHAAIEFAEEDGETMVVVASDHETGGMTVGANGSDSANPDMLKNVTATGENMAAKLNEDRSNIGEVVSQHTGITLNEEEIQTIEETEDVKAAINEVISERANIGWTSDNHTAVDVPVYAYGPGADKFTGFLDNTDLPKIIADVTDVGLKENHQQSKVHTVQPGETLFEIGRQNNYLWTTLQEINQLPNPHLIYPGEKVRFQ
ncbi:alkaline phosphatase [Geomicrobium halophilum]|uniref:Alkaline phosphatase n=1 Tax=Geomicrobium halophilum TaxID=549000 RepID=A0A841PW67_9BACL|nr:alkaline phosphatase [Geomicrobium halophilum]MBB6450651.1 alkaline phosphatase [Geomicrobium halophilum]